MKYNNHHDNDGNGDNVVRNNVAHKKAEEVVVHKIQVVVADENEVHSNTFFYLII